MSHDPVVTYYCLQSAKCSSGDRPCARFKYKQLRASFTIHRVFHSFDESISLWNDVSRLFYNILYGNRERKKGISKNEEKNDGTHN